MEKATVLRVSCCCGGGGVAIASFCNFVIVSLRRSYSELSNVFDDVSTIGGGGVASVFCGGGGAGVAAAIAIGIFDGPPDVDGL